MLGRRRHHRMSGFGRHRRSFLRGFGDPGFSDDLKDVAIGTGAGLAGLLVWTFTGARLIARLVADEKTAMWTQIGVGGVLGTVGGTLLTRANRPAGIGVGAMLGGGALMAAIGVALQAAGAGTPVSAYPYSRRYGMHGLGQRDPYGYAPFGMLGQPKPTYYGFDIGRTRSVELTPPGMQLNQRDPYGYAPFGGLGRTRVIDLAPPGFQLEAYPYSRRYGMHGMGAAWRYKSSAL